MGKRHKFPMDFDNNSSSTSSSDDTSPDKAKRRKRRTRSSVNARKTEDKDIIRMLAQLNDQMCRQSDQLTQLTENKDDTCEMRKQMDNLIERQNGQCKVLEKLIESQNGQFKVLEKLIESQNGQSKELEKLIENQNGQSKELEKLAASIREQLEFHTNITGHAESDAPRSQMNQVQTPRYRLVFRSPPIDKIERGKTIDISVALVDGINNQPVENGPLASATVELVVVNSKFNQHDNQYNWPIEDFECNIVKQRCENSAKGDADQSVKSIVSNSQFNLVRGARRYSGSTIFDNSHNKKVRLGVMVVSPTKERVLEGLSNPFFVRDHVRSGRQSNLHPNSSNGQRQGLGGNDYQEENSSMPNLQQPSWSNSTHTGGIRSNIIGGQSQLPFLGTSHMLSTEPFTSQEQQSSIQQYQSPHVPMVAQATYNQNDELAWASNYLAREPNFMGNNDHVLGHAIDMQFPTIMPLQLVWDRPNVGPIKRDWNLLDQLMPLPKFNNCGLVTKLLMQEHLVSRTIISKEVMQARRNTGVIIEPLEPDDSDEERQLKRKMHSKYQLRFENKVCEGYHIMDPIKADDGNLLKVALFDGNRKITNGPLSSASVQIIVLHGDFNEHGQDYWTLEEFSRYEVCPRPGEEASSVLGGDCILVLSDGEACLSDAFFQMTSYCARTGKFKMGVRLASAQEERIQEGVSEPFWVKDRHCAGIADKTKQEAAPAAAAAEVAMTEAEGDEAAEMDGAGSFKEESNLVSELPDPERTALAQFKELVAAALANGEFDLPTQPPAKDEEPKAETAAAEEPAKEEGKLAAAEEPKAEARAPAEDAAEEVKAEAPAPEEPKADEPAKEEEEPNKAEAASEEAKPSEPEEKTVVVAVEEGTKTAEAIEATVDPAASEPAVATAEAEAAPAPAAEPKEELIWGVPLVGDDERTDTVLLKFLRARDFKVKDAMAMLKSAVLWRKRFGINELLGADLGLPELENVVSYRGADREGHPVCYNVYGEFQNKELYEKAFGDEEKRERFLKWRIQLLERSIREQLDFSPRGISSMVQVTDLKNSPPMLGKHRAVTRQALAMLQDNYPEFVAKKVFINVPWWFLAANKMMSPFLSQRTRSKIVFCSPGKSAETLFRYIAPEQVPVQFGGLYQEDGTEFTTSDAVTELTVKPSSKETIEIPATENSTVVWELRVLGWEVSYGAELTPDAEGGHTVTVEKTRKVPAHEEPVMKGSFKVNEPGKVLLTVNNPASKKKKLLLYRFKVKSTACVTLLT